METNPPEPTTPVTKTEWVLAPPEQPLQDGGPRHSMMRRTVAVVAGLAVGAMIAGGVMASDVLTGVESDDASPATSDVAPKATLVDTVQSPSASMPKSHDDGDDDGEHAIDDDGEESEAGK